MEPMTMFMLSMRAAGAASAFFDQHNSKQMLKMGRDLEHAGIEANLELAKASAAEESLDALQNLRQTLGSQIAVQAARGTSSGAGSAMFIQQSSQSEFDKGERSRRMNLLSQQAGLRASDAKSELGLYKSETQLGQQTTGRLAKLVDTMQTRSGSAFLNNKMSKK